MSHVLLVLLQRYRHIATGIAVHLAVLPHSPHIHSCHLVSTITITVSSQSPRCESRYSRVSQRSETSCRLRYV
ncbi:hypothetical protein K402DRAFT_23408 [Aulographum hederae CBS 113979]|uniref:Uncharacterized protein n=1 Tax=Aulographum hederae CBS 113979 TaxID=1176131 RepID=A0A6G1H5S8_9PEZI|nr:hypothetical protein K402DRAFT_23408 [Aulographum hederae CBS 113979]